MMQFKNDFSMKRAALFVLLLSGLSVFLPMPVQATQSVTLAWSPSTDPNVAGYNIYYGTASHVYTNRVSVGNVVSATTAGLVEGATYYFAATTYNAQNQESTFSQEISYTVPQAVAVQPPAITGASATNLALAGQNVTFSITANSTGPLTYQWLDNGNPITAATNAVLTLNNVTTAQAGTYSVVVANSAGTTNLSLATLAVYGSTAGTLTPAAHVKGQFALNVSGVPNAQYVVQASTNLVNWVAVQTNSAPFTFVDAVAGQFSRRFYRTVLLSSLPAADITNGLAAYYPLAANGNDAWAGNNLTLAGSPSFSAGAINWNGAVPTFGFSSPQVWPQTSLTVSAWINMADPTANYSVAACYGNFNGTVGGAYMQFFANASGLTARIVQKTDVIYIGRSTPASLTTGWHQVAFTWAGGTSSSAIKIYLDGTQIDNADNNGGTFTGPYAGSDVPFSAGAQLSDGYGIYGKFTGAEKGLRMYGRALSGTEIGALYANGTTGGIY